MKPHLRLRGTRACPCRGGTRPWASHLWHSCIASAAAVASSSREALAMSKPVMSHTMVWKLSKLSSLPWDTSGWYGVYWVTLRGKQKTTSRLCLSYPEKGKWNAFVFKFNPQTSWELRNTPIRKILRWSIWLDLKLLRRINMKYTLGVPVRKFPERVNWGRSPSRNVGTESPWMWTAPSKTIGLKKKAGS